MTELLHGITLKHAKQGFIGIDDLLIPIRMIDEKSSRHLIHKLPYLMSHVDALGFRPGCLAVRKIRFLFVERI